MLEDGVSSSATCGMFVRQDYSEILAMWRLPVGGLTVRRGFNNPVCLQGRVTPPALGFGSVGSAQERLLF